MRQYINSEEGMLGAGFNNSNTTNSPNKRKEEEV